MKDQLERIASEKNYPCVSISLNTHRTYPDNKSDSIELKKLLKEAERRVIAQFETRTVKELLEKMEALGSEIDNNYNSDSLHIFLSNSTKEIIKSPWAIPENSLHVAETFSIKPLIKLFNRIENYMIILLSQSGVKLFNAINDSIIEEVENDDFPFSKNLPNLTHDDRISNAQHVDNSVAEYLNMVDKAVLKVHHETKMNFIVICTEDNYSSLMLVADKPSIYLGHIHINLNDVSNNNIVTGAWKIINELQKKNRAEAITEMQEAVGQGHVITDLSAIYKAAKEGRGDLLIANDDFNQLVKKTGDFSFDLVDDVSGSDVLEDLSSEIAWEVISKKGRAVFTKQKEINSFGDIALKVRY